MPAIGSFASMSKNGFSSATTTGPANSYRWFDSLFFKSNNDGYRVTGKKIGTEVWLFGANGTASSPGYRPYIAQLDVITGIPSYYKVFSDSTSNYIIGLEKDSSNNKHILWISGCGLTQYDTSDNFVVGNTYAGSGGSIGSAVNLVKDSSDFLYILSVSGTSYCVITKINSAGYAVVWSIKLTLTTNSAKLYIDANDNLYLVVYTNTGTVVTLFQINTAGTVNWQQSSSFGSSIPVLSFDSTNNIFMLSPGSPGIVIKLDNTGTQLYAYNVNTVTGLGTYTSILINSDDNISLLQNYQAGSSNYVLTCILDSSATVLYATQFAQGVAGSSPWMYPVNMISIDGMSYITCTMNNGGGTTCNTNLKVVNNNNIVYSTPFNFNIQKDNGSTTNFAGTLTTTAKTLPTKTSATIAWTSTLYSANSVIVVATSTTRTLGSTVPDTYSIPLI